MAKSNGFQSEEEEKIMTIGQEDEKKAMNPIREVLKEEEKKEQKKIDTTLNKLDSLTSQFKSYKTMLMQELHDGIERLGVPKEFTWGVWFDGKGIRVCFVSPKTKTRYERAFKPTNEPQYDLNAVREFIVWAEDTIDAVAPQPQKQNGLWIPNKN